MTTTTAPTGADRWWADITVVEPAGARIWLLAAAVAVATDLLARPGMGVGPALLVAVAVAALLASGRVARPAAWAMAGVAPLFGAFLAVRSSPWLLPLDVLATGGLIVLAASFARDGDPLDTSLPGLVARGLVALVHGVAGPVFLLTGLRRAAVRMPEGSTARTALPGVGRGIVLAVPVVAVLGLLLASADPVFASFFRLPTSAGAVVVHGVLLALGAAGAAGLLRMVSAVPMGELPAVRARLGFVESATLLASLVLLYAVFALSQLVAVLGGDRRVTRTAGLTYAEYARSGFFQLVAVAALTLGVLLAVRAAADLSTPARARRFMVLAELEVALTLVVVVVAVRRLHLYEKAYGLTMLRLCSTAVALWIGGVFLLLAAAFAGLGRPRRWLVPAAVVVGLTGLLAVGLADPEAVVVRRNLDLYESTGRLDIAYLDDLSDDAVPALASALPRLDPANRELVLGRLCAGADHPDDGWLGWNRSQRRAAAARERVCPAD